MTANSCKWTLFGIIALALCGWLARISLLHEAIVQQLADKSKERAAQIEIISSFNQWFTRVNRLRDSEFGERSDLEDALGYTHSKGLSKKLLESFELPSDEFALYTNNQLGSGFFLRSDRETNIVAYVRMLSPGSQWNRSPKYLKQTLESPDLRIVLPTELHQLTAYELETAGPTDKLKFGISVTSRDIDRFLPFCDAKNNYDLAATDGPYNGGIFRNREHEITYGWGDLADIDFVKILHERGIWVIACNETYRTPIGPNNQFKFVHIVIAFTSEREWRIHPDYTYCRGLESASSLEWDPEQQNYLATPIAR